MTVRDEESPRPLFKRWQLALLACFLVVASIVSVIAYRNVQQWNAALKFRQQVKAARGEAEIQQISPFTSLMPGSAGRSAFLWSVVRLVHLRDDASVERLREIDWSQLPRLHTVNLVINHPEFSDGDLAKIPDDASFYDLNIAATSITNAGIDKIKRFPKLESLSIEATDINDAGLLRLVIETKLSIRAHLRPADLTALAQVNGLPRIKRCVVIADETFRAEQLTGLNPSEGIEFRGDFHPVALTGMASVYRRDPLLFRHAVLHLENLTDIGRLPELKTVIFTDCEIKNASSKAPATAEPTNPRRNGEPLVIVARNTTIEPGHLQAFSTTVISITVHGKRIDDVWFEAVMNMPHVDSVELIDTAVSDLARSKYEAVPLRTGTMYRRHANTAAQP